MILNREDLAKVICLLVETARNFIGDDTIQDCLEKACKNVDYRLYMRWKTMRSLKTKMGSSQYLITH